MRIRHFNNLAEKNLVSPAGRFNNKKESSSSPTETTVAETPSPGGNDFSPDTIQVKKVVEESPVKPFDEGKEAGTPNFEAVWDTADDEEQIVTSNNVTGRKSSFHTRYLNQIMSGDASPELPAKEITKQPVPFLSPGSPIQKASPSLSDEIALAQKMGMEETLASAPESAQRALVMQSRSPDAALRSYNMASAPLSPMEDANPMIPHSLFKTSDYTQDYDKVDELLDRGFEDVTEEPASKVDVSMASDESVPFDCTPEHIKASNNFASRMKRALYRAFFEPYYPDPPVVTLKKGPGDTSNVGTNNALRSLQDNSADPSEIRTYDEKKEEGFEQEPFSSMAYNSRDLSYEEEFVTYTIRRGEDSSEKISSGKRRKCGARTALLCVAIVVLIIVGIIASLVAGGRLNFWSNNNFRKDSNAPVDYFSDDVLAAVEATIPSETFVPTQILDETNLFEGSKTIACQNAVPLTEMDQPYFGSNWKAFWDVSIDTCGDQMSTGYAVWYSYTTTASKLVQASTCGNADFDTQITIMSGSCEETTCVSFNDQGCGDQSLVTWYAEAGTTYYIMVHGYREASGTFALTLSDASSNDQLSNAMKLNGENVAAGTTAGAISSEKPPQCGDVDLSGDGVWYEIDNVSGFFKAEILLGYTEFSGQVAVYRATDSVNMTAGDLICEDGSSSGSALWLADAAEKYYVYVTGKNETVGDFDIFLGRNKAASCKFGKRIDPSGVGMVASTKFENPQNVESCGYTGYHTAPGLWFSVVGTGQMLEASTCGSFGDLDTQISVFQSSCDSLECVGGTGEDYPCGANGSVKWQSEFGEVYSVYVSGRSSRVGDFVLTIDEATVEDGFTCGTSFALDTGSTIFESDTLTVPSEPVNLCTGTSPVRGGWHKFVGTGMATKISVCNDETDFDARVSLFAGSCGSLTCVAHTENICGENDEILVTTHLGEEYYLFVHGSDSVSIGNYMLTIEEATTNDSCPFASSIELSSQSVGSTLSARNSTVMGCNGKTDIESEGLWYTFEGTGQILSISTCSSHTDLNTDIRIFSGTCSDFNCIPFSSERSCGDQSTVAFQSEVGQIYHARIGGLSAGDVGHFILELNPPRRFFGA